MNDATDAERIGTVVAERYRIDASIGRGGMATVYRATHVRTGRAVALKVLHERPDWGAVETERFVREARIAASLTHPAIVEVIDADATQGTAFIALELLEGESLASRLDRERPISAREAVDVMAPILEALAVAHRAGVVHRDIKPENIFLERRSDGSVQPRLLDFGVSKVLPNGTRETTLQRSLTATGNVVGTIDYMSPEQIRGDDIDATTDLWSVGVVLYLMVTGRMPFRAKNKPLVVMAILMTNAVPVETLAADVPPAFASIVNSLLGRDRATRPSDAMDVRAKLMASLEETATRTQPLPRRSPPVDDEARAIVKTGLSAQPLAQRPVTRRGLAWGIAAVLVVSGAIGGTIALSHRDGSSSQSRARPTAVPPVPLMRIANPTSGGPPPTRTETAPPVADTAPRVSQRPPSPVEPVTASVPVAPREQRGPHRTRRGTENGASQASTPASSTGARPGAIDHGAMSPSVDIDGT